MGIKDPRVDAYIAKSATFAQPILMHMRKLVHTHCPDVIETIKWGRACRTSITRAVFFAAWLRSRHIAHFAFG